MDVVRSPSRITNRLSIVLCDPSCVPAGELEIGGPLFNVAEAISEGLEFTESTHNVVLGESPAPMGIMDVLEECEAPETLESNILPKQHQQQDSVQRDYTSLPCNSQFPAYSNPFFEPARPCTDSGTVPAGWDEERLMQVGPTPCAQLQPLKQQSEQLASSRGMSSLSGITDSCRPVVPFQRSSLSMPSSQAPLSSSRLIPGARISLPGESVECVLAEWCKY